MVKLENGGVYLKGGKIVKAEAPDKAVREKTMAYSILRSHSKNSGGGIMNIRFDSLISHDITYVGIIQTAKASGLEKFPVHMP